MQDQAGLIFSLYDLDVRQTCRACDEGMIDQDSSKCEKCETVQLPPPCSVCRLPVRGKSILGFQCAVGRSNDDHPLGLSTICSTCLHVAHQSCLSGWRSAMSDDVLVCPQGCGCSCQSTGGLQTSFGILPSFGSDTLLGLALPLGDLTSSMYLDSPIAAD